MAYHIERIKLFYLASYCQLIPFLIKNPLSVISLSSVIETFTPNLSLIFESPYQKWCLLHFLQTENIQLGIGYSGCLFIKHRNTFSATVSNAGVLSSTVPTNTSFNETPSRGFVISSSPVRVQPWMTNGTFSLRAKLCRFSRKLSLILKFLNLGKSISMMPPISLNRSCHKISSARCATREVVSDLGLLHFQCLYQSK